jgi:hypothetical protein
VILLDVSGSMSGQLRRVGEATWAIRRAVDELEGKATALTFSDAWAVMNESDRRPDGRVFVPSPVGGTQVAGAMREAARIVSESEAINRMVVVLTDGGWWDEAAATKSVGLIHECDGVVVIAGLGGSVHEGQCGADHVKQIRTPADLALLFRDVALDMARRRMVPA